MKKAILPLLFLANCTTTLPVVYRKNNTENAKAIGALVGLSAGLIARGVAAHKAKKNQERDVRNTQKAHLKKALNSTKKQSLTDLIGPITPLQNPVDEPKNSSSPAIILMLLTSIILAISLRRKQRHHA